MSACADASDWKPSACADATSSSLFPSLSPSAPAPTEGFAYVRLGCDAHGKELAAEICEWCAKAVPDADLAPARAAGADNASSRAAAAELHVTVATGIRPEALAEVEALHGSDGAGAPWLDSFPVELGELAVEEDGEDLAVCIGVKETAELTQMHHELAKLEGVDPDDEAFTPRVVVARVRGVGTGDDAEVQRVADLRRRIGEQKRFFMAKSCEAGELCALSSIPRMRRRCSAVTHS